MLSRDNWCDDVIVCCLCSSMAGQMSSNMYRSFGTHNTYTSVDKQQLMKYMCIRVSSVKLIKRYDISSVSLHLFQDDANCRIDHNHLETLIICEKVRDYLLSHGRH